MAAVITRRAGYMRALWRSTSSRSNSHPILPASIRSSSMFQHSRVSSPGFLSRFRQEPLFLSSLLPVHSAIASACLVSKLPSEASTSTEALPTTSSYWSLICLFCLCFTLMLSVWYLLA